MKSAAQTPGSDSLARGVRRRGPVMLVARSLLVVACSVTTAATAAFAGPDRIVSIGATVTETVVALGAGSDIVGIDTTSEPPATAPALPRVGYLRTLGAEGILSLGPTLVLASSDAGPPAVLEQIRASGVRCVVVPEVPSEVGAEALIRAVGEATGKADRAAALTETLHKELASARKRIESLPGAPEVLFVVQPPRAGGALAAGRGTPADAMIVMAGARNAATAFESYRPITPEVAATMAVDVIVAPAGTIAKAGGKEAFLDAVGLSRTQAGSDGRVVEVPASALSFGPATGTRVFEFATLLRQPAAAGK
jgi:iron complex transport system substrate-binding protein